MDLLSVEKNVVGLMLIVIPVFTVMILIILSWQSIPKKCFIDQKAEADMIIENLASCSDLCWGKHGSGSDSIIDDCFAINVLSTKSITNDQLSELKTKKTFMKINFNDVPAEKKYQIKIRYDGFDREVELFAEEIIERSTTTTTTNIVISTTTSTIPGVTTTTLPLNIDDLVNRMSIEQLVEQTIMSTLEGSKYKNFYLFRWQITPGFSPTPVKINNKEIWPLVATDGEGGRVRRLPKDTTPGRISAREIGNLYESGSMTLNDVRTHAQDIAKEMKQYKLNTNLAPVLDISSSGLMFNDWRSFSGDPNKVEDIAQAFIQGLHDEGIIVTGKHFPGYGNQAANSDNQKVTDSRIMEDLENSHLKPYIGLTNELDMIMMNSIIYTNIDSNNPAVFSPTLINKAKLISSKAVLITDSLSGISSNLGISFNDMVKKAITNNDMLLFSSPTLADSAHTTIVSMINSREISKESIKEKVTRILSLKEKYGLIKTVGSIDESAQPKIGVIGDSITVDEIYPKKLQDLLRQQYPDAEVYSHGHGGDTTIAISGRFEDDILNNPHNYNTVIIQGGVNDIASSFNIESITKSNLRKMYDLAIQKNKKVIALTILPWGSFYSNKPEKETFEKKTKELNDWMKQQSDIIVIDFSSMGDETNPSKLKSVYDWGDGLHPNPTGKEEMARLIALQAYGIN